MKATDVKAAIRNKFSGNEWAVFFEVANGTGANSRRYADAVAMNLWPSRGLELHGFEIKVSRSDWLSELKNPEKSDAIQQYCDRWWIITPPGIIKPGEMPPTWGQYQVSDKGQIKQVIAAPKLEPKDVNRKFMAALMRRAGEVDQSEVFSMVNARVAEEKKRIQQHADREVERLTEKYEELRKKLEAINSATGIELSRWTPESEVVACIKLVQQLGVFKTHGTLQRLKQSAENFNTEVDKALCGLKVSDESASDLSSIFKAAKA